jgi:hypothetical protein
MPKNLRRTCAVMKKMRSNYYGLVAQVTVVIATLTLVSIPAARARRHEGPIDNHNRTDIPLPEQEKGRPVNRDDRVVDPNSNEDGGGKTEEETDTIVGKVISNHCHLSPDGKDVITNYRVWVTEVREGSLLTGSTIIVTIRGGLVLLKADGTEVRTGNTLTGKAKKEKVQVEIPNDASSDTKIPVELSGVTSTKYTPFDRGQIMQNDKVYLLTLTRNPNAKGFVLSIPPRLTDN